MSEEISRRSFLIGSFKTIGGVIIGGALLGSVGCSSGGGSSNFGTSTQADQIRIVVEDIQAGQSCLLDISLTVSEEFDFERLLQKLYDEELINSYTYGQREFSSGVRGEFLSQIDGMTHTDGKGWIGSLNDQLVKTTFSDLRIGPGDCLKLQYKQE